MNAAAWNAQFESEQRLGFNKPLRGFLLLCIFLISLSASGFARQTTKSPPAIVRQTSTERNGQRDFDFEIGTWRTRLSRLLNPLTGSNQWVEYEGITTVRKVWDGRANLVELAVDGPAGHLEGLSLRLYNPQSRQWSLNFSNSRSGTMSPPGYGSFKNERGEFYSQETYQDRSILVRFVITKLTADSCRFEQAFSDDGGKTWEVNWIAVDTRVKDVAEKKP